MTDYGVLLVGCKRSHQESHAAVFAAQPRCRLVAVAAEAGDPEGRVHQYQQLADELNLPFIPDLDEALARDDVHIVSSTPAVERRGAVAVRCLEAGKHVYLDKPLAGSVEDADAIVAASRRAVGRAQMFTQNEAGWVKAARRPSRKDVSARSRRYTPRLCSPREGPGACPMQPCAARKRASSDGLSWRPNARCST